MYRLVCKILSLYPLVLPRVGGFLSQDHLHNLNFFFDKKWSNSKNKILFKSVFYDFKIYIQYLSG